MSSDASRVAVESFYLPPDLAPEPTMDERAFWECCAHRRLAFQRCAACGRHRHPPGPRCPACRSADIAWSDAPEVAEVFSYTIVHYASHPAMAPHLPYNVAVVTFPDLDDVRLVTNIVDAAPEDLYVGMKVRLHWEGPVAGTYLPRFRRVLP